VVSAVDTVVKFAIDRLGYKQQDIILFAWSIGGYPCSWAAAHYPEIRGVVLDATFDDVVPLAVAKMPPSWRPIVVHTVKSYFNLNISDNMNYYNGPALFVRRLQDEIIHTLETDPVRTNRANDLLVKLLSTRFPNLMKEEDPRWALNDWMSGNRDHQVRVERQYQLNGDLCLATLASYIESTDSCDSYPVNIGHGLSDDVKIQLVLYLAGKHLIDYDSTHCTPLPKHMFREPFDLFNAIKGTSSANSKSNL
jgi:pimeloyl-ACP methyl ester carboxylesterase